MDSILRVVVTRVRDFCLRKNTNRNTMDLSRPLIRTNTETPETAAIPFNTPLLKRKDKINHRINSFKRILRTDKFQLKMKTKEQIEFLFIDRRTDTKKEGIMISLLHRHLLTFRWIAPDLSGHPKGKSDNQLLHSTIQRRHLLNPCQTRSIEINLRQSIKVALHHSLPTKSLRIQTFILLKFRRYFLVKILLSSIQRRFN